MAYDLKITGGQIIDGTGEARFAGDIGIKDGKIAAVGECPDSADREIDAAGAFVTPGFVDIHTHYDGQVSWDPDMAPSSIHGVTTAVMGSCGVGFAPVREADHVRIIELMEGVEDIPGTALAEGITWGWETFGEYMDKIDSFAHTIDFAAMVPHDVLRVYVMGERGAYTEPASKEDIEKMRQAVSDALDAGAVGFSTGRSDNHRTAAGDPTPASEALTEELIGIAKAFHGRKKGVLQAVSDFDILHSDERFHPEFDILEEFAAAADGHPLSISTMQRDQSPNQWKWIIERVEKAKEKGLDIRMQVAPRPIGVLLGLNASFHPFMGMPTYKTISQLPLEEQVRHMRDPEFKKKVISEDMEPVSGDGSAIPPLADLLLQQIEKVSMRIYRLGETPDYEPGLDDCLYKEAMQTGKPVLEVIYDAMLERDGHALLYFPVYNYTNFSLENVRTMLNHPQSLPGLSDGGAHVGTICDASFPTYFMQHWGRDREKGRMPIEKIIHRMTGQTSDYMSFEDRGKIKPGLKADLNIIDFDNLQLESPRMINDLPAGGRRIMQGAKGYVATLVSGQVIAENGKLTGERPGKLLRAN